MAKVRQKGTKAEVELRQELYRKGLRYLVGYVVLRKPHRIADIAFPGLKIAIFVDGCFWHGCPEHVTWPKQNADFWRNKIESNHSRDVDTSARLKEIGWTVIRLWEHESPAAAAETISKFVAKAKSQNGQFRR